MLFKRVGYVSSSRVLSCYVVHLHFHDASSQGINLQVHFKPILSAYIACNYRQSEVLRSEMRNVKPIWQGDLTALGSSATIIIQKNPTGEYVANMVDPGYFGNVANSQELVADDVVESVSVAETATVVNHAIVRLPRTSCATLAKLTFCRLSRSWLKASRRRSWR